MTDFTLQGVVTKSHTEWVKDDELGGVKPVRVIDEIKLTSIEAAVSLMSEALPYLYTAPPRSDSRTPHQIAEDMRRLIEDG